MQARPALLPPGIARPSGLPTIGELSWGSHVCQFYRTEEDLSDTLVPFFKAGLEANERCLWITSQCFSVEKARAALGAALPDLDERISRGDIEIVDYESSYLRPGEIDADGDEAVSDCLKRETDALAAGYAGLRVGGNVFRLDQEHLAAFAPYEARVHEAFHTRHIIALCSYCLSHCNADDLIDVLRNHDCALVRREQCWEAVQSATLMLAATQVSAGADPLDPPLHYSVRGRASASSILRAHAVQFFDQNRFPAERIAERVDRSLAEGAAAFVFARREHLEQIGQELESFGRDVEAIAREGQLVFADAETMADLIVDKGVARKSVFNERIAATIERAIDRYGSVRAYGEIVDVLSSRRDFANALQIERWWNELLDDGKPLELLCGYALDRFADSAHVGTFHDICAEHADVAPVPRTDDPDPRRAIAALQQAMAALENEGTERRRVESQRKRLQAQERNARARARAVTEHLTLLQRLTSSLLESVSAAEITQVVVGELCATFGADAAAVFLCNGSGDLCLAASCHLSSSQSERFRSLQPEARLPVCSAFRSGTPIWLTSSSTLEADYPEMSDEDRQAGTTGCVPLMLGRQRLGAISIVYQTPREQATWERALLEDYANQVALAIDRAQSYEEAQKARSRLQLLADAASQIAQAKLDMARVADTLVQEATRSGFADCCAIELCTEGDSTPNIASIHRIGSMSADGSDGLIVRSKIVAAVRASGQELGTLSAVRYSGADFKPEEQRLLQDLADRAALSFENALLYQRAQEERERAEHERARAETANRAKDEFLAMLGHELRNPLSPILTAVQLMQLRSGGLLDKERTIIERQVNHMVRLVDDLLDISRITRGKVQLKTAKVELATAVADAIEIASPLFEERSHKLVTSVPTSGLLVDADPDRLAQIIANLLSNAAKYTAANGTIVVTGKAKGSTVTVSVRDNGVGIEPALLPRVFDSFVQGRQAPDRAQGGLGLGLAIARNLVELHGGTLRAHSEGVGRGSTFTIELPAAAGARAAREQENHAPISTIVERSRRVLIVDDNVDAAQMLSEFLGSFGHKVCIAHDGPSALKIAKDFCPELALLDIGLPVMDGHELGGKLTALLHEHPPKLVAVTGYGHEADRRRSNEAGFDEHLVKPIDLERLRTMIVSLFAQSAANYGSTAQLRIVQG